MHKFEKITLINSLNPYHPTILKWAISALLILACSNASFSQTTRPTVIQGERKHGYRISKIWKPTIFQGGHRKHDYYEGWYFKCVSADGQQSFALIPGIAMGTKGSHGHAFIQYIDGKTADTHWFEFPATAFSYSQRSFQVRIDDNYFSADSLHVDVGEGKERLQVDLRFSDLHPWPVRAFSPGIMGGYRFVPGMETCHGLVSLHHRVDGSISHGGVQQVLENGRGYIEKDWGSSFPRSYVWMQSNRFGQEEASFMISIATIPYLGKYFRGFLGFFWYQGQLYCFATYTHAHLEDVKLEENEVSFTIKERKFRIEVHATRRASGLLKAPQKGEMERRIAESIDAVIDLKVTDQKGNRIFEGRGQEAGLEIVGNRTELMND